MERTTRPRKVRIVDGLSPIPVTGTTRVAPVVVDGDTLSDLMWEAAVDEIYHCTLNQYRPAPFEHSIFSWGAVTSSQEERFQADLMPNHDDILADMLSTDSSIMSHQKSRPIRWSR
jgi:hypothetical protein